MSGVLILAVKNIIAAKNIIFELNVTRLGIKKFLNIFPVVSIERTLQKRCDA